MIADSPATYKAVAIAAVGNGWAKYYEIASDVVTLTGGIIIAVSGLYLCMRYASQSKLNLAEAARAEAEERVAWMRAERLQMDMEELKAAKIKEERAENAKTRASDIAC